jgi:hypothetical protein
LLPNVSLDRGVLKIAPIEKSTPPAAEMLAARLYAMLPRIRVTDLLSEVARWTLFADCFTHLRSGETVADPRVLMAGLLADGLNLGLTRMAHVEGGFLVCGKAPAPVTQVGQSCSRTGKVA